MVQRGALAGVLALLVFAAAALAAEGSLETNFNTTGKLSSTFGGTSSEIFGSAVQSDGKLVVVGQSDSVGVVARFNPDGSFDSGFGVGGIRIVDSGTTSGGQRLRAVAIQSDGKIVAVGDASLATTGPFVVARLNSDGSLDTTFDGPGVAGNGVFRILQGTNDTGTAVVVSGSKIVFGGHVDGYPYVYELNSDGSLDTAGFGSPNGFVTFNFGAGTSFLSGLAVQPGDGKIIAVGKPNNIAAGIGVARLTTAGALDTTTFNSPNGVVVLAPPATYFGGNGASVLVDPGGRILVGGSLTSSTSPYPTDPAIAGVTSAGALDGTFGSGGYAILPLPGNNDRAVGIARQPDGKLVIGGTAGCGPCQFLVARFSATGTLDTSFASPAGYTTTDFSGTSTIGNAFALSNTGVAYVSGGVGATFPTNNFGIAAFRAFTPPVVTPPPPPASNPTPPTGQQAAALKKCKKKHGKKRKKCVKKAHLLPV